MKLKPKLRHFWRNNKLTTGMYATFINLAVGIALATIGQLAAIHSAVYSLLWAIIWHKERQCDAASRCHYVNKHRCKKYINEMHWRGLKEGHQVGYASGYDKGFEDASNKQE